MSDFAQDEVCGSSPHEGLGLLVVSLDVVLDGLSESRDAQEVAAADALLGDLGKEALDLIEPGTVSGNEMSVPTWMAGQPAHHFGCLVRRVVVQHHVNVHLLGYLGIHMP